MNVFEDCERERVKGKGKEGREKIEKLTSHVHPHRVSGTRRKSNVQRPSRHPTLDPLKPSEPRSRIESSLDDRHSLYGIQPPLSLSRESDGREVDGRSSSHSVLSDNGGDSSSSVESLASSRGGSDEGSFGSGHGDGERFPVDGERSSDSDGERHVSDDVLAAGSEDFGVVVAGHGEVGGFEGFGDGGSSWRRENDEAKARKGKERVSSCLFAKSQSGGRERRDIRKKRGGYSQITALRILTALSKSCKIFSKAYGAILPFCVIMITSSSDNSNAPNPPFKISTHSSKGRIFDDVVGDKMAGPFPLVSPSRLGRSWDSLANEADDLGAGERTRLGMGFSYLGVIS